MRIIGRNKNSVRYDPSIRRGDDIETQLEFDERTIVVQHRVRHLQRRIAGGKVLEGFKESVGNPQIVRLQFMCEINIMLHSIRVKAVNPAVYQLPRKIKSRTQQAALRQINCSWIDALIRRDAASAEDRATGVGLLLRSCWFRGLAFLIRPIQASMRVVVIKATV